MFRFFYTGLLFLFSIISISFINANEGVTDFEKFAGNVYKTIKENNFPDFYALCLTPEEHRQFLEQNNIENSVVERLVNERSAYATKDAFENAFSKIQKYPENENVSWSQTEILKFVPRLDQDGQTGEIRIVAGYREKEFVLICTKCFLTKNGWKLFSDPVFISI